MIQNIPSEYANHFKKMLFELVGFSDEQWKSFSQALQISTYKKGAIILKSADVENRLSFVAVGLTRHFLFAGEKEISFDFSFAGHFCSSYASFLMRMPSKVSVEALIDTVLLSISYENLQKWFALSAENQKTGRVLSEGYFLWREMREMSLLTETAEQRYQHLLHHYPEYLRLIPQKYIASFLNIEPHSLSRIKKRLYNQRKSDIS